MSNSLMEAHHRDKTSVAFPSIGTGKRRFPPHLVAVIMLEGVIKFSRRYKGRTSVKDVRFVVFPTDDEIVQVCRSVPHCSRKGTRKLHMVLCISEHTSRNENN